jgi:multidrug efflux pump subunit AcrB
MKGFNPSRWAIEHRSLAWYLMLVCLFAGAFSYLRLARDEDPPFTVKTMVVRTLWPGATLDDTIEQVTDRIEKKLQELPALDHLDSETKPGQSTVFVRLRQDTRARAVAGIWYQVRKKVGDIGPSLPHGTLGPFFDDEFGDTFSMIYAFTADGFTQRELRDEVESIRSQLLGIDGVAKIELIGTQDEKIYIEFDTRQLSGRGISPEQAVASLRAQNAVTPAGTVETDEERIALRISGRFSSEESLGNVNLYANGRFYRLADVATIRRDYADPPQPMFRFNGEPAIGLAIAMVPGGDNLRFGADVRRKVFEIAADLPIGIEPHLVADQPSVVERAVGGFTEALWAAIAIVLAVSFFSLGLRAGAVVALSIPLVLAIVFLLMQVSAIALQRVSLGALVIALGLLVDDAMITIEMMVSQLERGVERIAAATRAYVTTAFPMLTGTLVTIAGFVPVGFARSNAGEYAFSLFAVIAMALVASWVVAILFSPVLGVTLLPQSEQHRSAGPGRFTATFRAVLLVAMRWRWLTIAVTLAAFGLAVIGMRFVQQEFFPASDRPELVIDLTLPQNASIPHTEAEVQRLEKLLARDPDIDRTSIYVGEGAVRFYLPFEPKLPNEWFAQAVIVSKGLAQRKALQARLEPMLAEAFPGFVTRIYPLELGPPVGWPLQYRVSGPRLQQVRNLAYRVAGILAPDGDARKVNLDWNEPMKVVRIRVDQARARELGVSSQTLSEIINATVSGMTITQIRDGIYLIDVVARASPAEHASLETLRDLQIPLGGGRTIPLLEVASLDYSLQQPLVRRRDRLPTITVQADVAPGVQAKSVAAQLAPQIASFASGLPAEYRVETGGTQEASATGLRSVIAVVPVMLVLMVTILMVQLQSFQRLFMVVSVAPLGLIGVAAALLLTGTPMGFIAILGIVALTGIIIRNSVILVDQIAANTEARQNPWDAVVAAATGRLRPILLTAAAASLGMLPIARDVFWGPMAYAMIGGLVSATLLTIFFLPALYVAWFRIAEMPAEASIARHASDEPA